MFRYESFVTVITHKRMPTSAAVNSNPIAIAHKETDGFMCSSN